MTPGEFEDRVAFYEDQEDRRWDVVGWVLAHLKSAITGKRQDASKLKPRKRGPKQQRRAGTARKELEDLKAIFEPVQPITPED